MAPSDYYINFNPDTTQGMFGDAAGGPETALVLKEMPCAKDGHMWTGDHFYILKGDFRAEYDALVKAGEGRWTLKHDVYDRFKHQHGSRWSTDFKEWGRDGDRRESPQATKAGATTRSEAVDLYLQLLREADAIFQRGRAGAGGRVPMSSIVSNSLEPLCAKHPHYDGSIRPPFGCAQCLQTWTLARLADDRKLRTAGQ